MEVVVAVCGIVGLQLRDADLRPHLGALVSDMLVCLTERGPDSAGLALYADDLPAACVRYSIRADTTDVDWSRLAGALEDELDAAVDVSQTYGSSAVLASHADDAAVLDGLAQLLPDAVVVGYGHAVEIFKDVGAPSEITERFRAATRGGYQAVGHTRMATESAVTTDGSHPFSPVADLCLVHNGSFSNYATVRRRLTDGGASFDTENDSEVAARHIARSLADGAALGDALRLVLKELDGFFTLLVTTATEFAVVRDPFACKPAVIAEHDRYVAMASEYHALAGLPGIDDADVFEPMPEEVHVWSR